MAQSPDFQIQSPDARITLNVMLTDQLYYGVEADGQEILWYTPLSMEIQQEGNHMMLGKNTKVRKHQTELVEETVNPVWGIRSEIKDRYRFLQLEMEGGYAIEFRAYNDGVAYRFITRMPGDLTVIAENVMYRWRENHQLLAHVVGDFQTSYEKTYTRTRLNDLAEKDYASLPLLVDQGHHKLVLAEADLYDYPGLYLGTKDQNARPELYGQFPHRASKVEAGGWQQFNMRVIEREAVLARTKGKRSFPWRLMVIAREDIELADNDLVYLLSRPSKIDTDWIKPGKVAWDWWNDWNLEGVDFETGVNTRTYEYYIDFAAENGLEYIIMDEGWSDQFDLLLQKPGVDVPHLVEYGKKKGVGVILWAVWHTIDRQMEAALDMMAEWGVAGVKVDFIDRDDQDAINFYERLAAACAKRKMLVDYHGCSKPTGMHRTYPNLINYEGVRGNEYNKFAQDESPEHNVNLVFTRMLTGPMDYTPGAMRNSTKGNFQTNNSNPMSYGTRCHQLGMYVVYYSPLQMLCDAPTAYQKYPDILEFLSQVPVSWDETVALEGKIGEYVVIARRKGNDWYLGALGDWEERKLQIDLSFLGEGTYNGTAFLDGINAHRKAEDYRVMEGSYTAQDSFRLVLKPGGGAAIHFKRN